MCSVNFPNSSFYCLFFHFFTFSSQTFSVDIYFAQIWQDLRLDFPNNTDKNRMYDVEWLNHFWRPDTYFRNAKSIQLQTLCVSNHYLELYENKTIKYTMKVALELTCSMDFAFYPHDTQKCVIRIESRKFNFYVLVSILPKPCGK